MIQDRLLKQKEVAEMIGMSEAWLEQCRFRKKGIPFVKMERACRYRSSDVQRFIDERVISSGV